MAIKLINDKAMNRTVSHLDGVVGEVENEATEIKSRAARTLKRHFHSGNAKITLKKSGDTDQLVTLDDPNAKSIEFGHYTKTKDGYVYVPGLYIVTKAAGLA